jgi:hypothetical protein
LTEWLTFIFVWLQGLFFLPEEDGGYDHGGDDAEEVGNEASGYGMARMAYAYRTEIDCQNVERCVRGSLENT